MITLPYSGSRRKLVLAFDIGTTYSGISYSILDPGQVPEIKGVTKFPAQEQVHGSSKIPSIIYYDQAGKIGAIGAETLSEGIFEQAEDKKWIKVEWFKLHLGPQLAIADDIRLQSLPPLPTNKTVIDVLADYLEYLFRCSQSYIEETHPDGKDFWKSVRSDIDFVLSHPNGWEGAQQSRTRKAALRASLVPDSSAGQSRITFVTEGEASLHFAIKHGLPLGATKSNDGVVIVDAGGGTIDISTYSRASNPVSQVFDEISAPQCYLYGSVFVNISLQNFLQTFLAESNFLDDIPHIVRCFDKTTKLRFRKADEDQFIKFGSARDNDVACSIRYGQLKLSGSDVASFFKPSVNCIIDGVKKQRETARKPFHHVVLVGGFAASDWLYQNVTDALEPLGYSVLRPDYYVNKAVSDGAISYYLDHHVQSRISKITYGTRASIDYDPTLPGHKIREHKTHRLLSGLTCLTAFSVILAMGEQVGDTDETRWHGSFGFGPDKRNLKIHTDLYRYRGHVTGRNAWMDEKEDLFSKICTIEADMSHLINSPTVQYLHGPDGIYRRVKFDIILLLGAVEIKALLAWMENGIEKRGDAKIIYLDDWKATDGSDKAADGSLDKTIDGIRSDKATDGSDNLKTSSRNRLAGWLARRR